MDFLPQRFGLVHFQKKGVWSHFILLPFSIKIPIFNANSVDRDQMPNNIGV